MFISVSADCLANISCFKNSFFLSIISQSSASTYFFLLIFTLLFRVNIFALLLQILIFEKYIFQLLNKGDQVVLISLKCLFSILAELSKRDPELCSDALGSLLKLLEQLNPDALSTELHSAVRSMHEILKQLRIEGKIFFHLAFFIQWRSKFVLIEDLLSSDCVIVRFIS